MKRILNLGVIVLLIFALAACSKPNAPTGGETSKEATGGSKTEEGGTEEIVPEEGAKLVLWDNGDKEGEWAKYVAEKFREQYDVPVKVEVVSHVDAPGKLQTDGPAGLGADVFSAASDHVGAMNTAGLIYDNYYADEYKDRFLEGAVSAVSNIDTSGESKVYGFPTSVESVALVYNKDLLAKMGLKPAKTMDELIQQSKEFMAENPGSYGLMIEPGNFYINYAFLGGMGGYIFGENNTDPSDIGLNNEGSVKAADFVKKIRDEILPLKKEDITGDVVSSYFNEGKLLYNITGPWAINGLQEAGINFGITPIPTLPNGEAPTPFSGVKGYYVNAYSKYPQAATLLAKFATSDEMLMKRFEMTGQLPPTQKLLEDKRVKDDEIKAAFALQVATAVPMPNITEMQSVWSSMEMAFTSIWNNDTDSKEALDKGVQQIKQSIASQTK
ncbi:maltose ABC transporter substrate-binding protein [Mesobacillus foraminis]|uniref:sugar ABC transporter substrate-binding protein n=1 Tax=Mesobacillus foraminis TaxID=279826 RepID=UPI0039A1EF5F